MSLRRCYTSMAFLPNATPYAFLKYNSVNMFFHILYIHEVFPLYDS